MSNILFMIEGGKPLEMVKNHIAERNRVNQANRALCDELGVTSAYIDRMTGVVNGVVFKAGAIPEGWKKPDSKGVSFPKKGSDALARLKQQQGFQNPAVEIAEAFNIPMNIGYGKPGEQASGWRCIGVPLQECGYLWLSHEGPYAMWIPDVEEEVKKSESEGFVVEEPAKSFKPKIEGCRLILEEEWEFLCAEDNLKRKRQEMAPAA